MPQLPKWKKFKSPEVEEYMLGKWFKQWSGIQPAEKARWRIKVVVNARNKKDFDAFSGFYLEPIEGVKDYYSIRIGGKWRCFFIWENNEAWEIDINDHDYKKVKR